MKKIPTLFVRKMDAEPRILVPELTPGCEWVLLGEGRPTRKRDGTACMVDDAGRHFRRYDAKHGKTPPSGFIPCQEPDPVTGHHPGWFPIGEGPEDKHYRACTWPTAPGTYELCGPKIQGNPERLSELRLFRHGDEEIDHHIIPPEGGIDDAFVRLIFDGMLVRFSGGGSYLIEGIVWHHADGRMAKLKRRDYGLDWPVEKPA
jgi:hypothetical protein